MIIALVALSSAALAFWVGYYLGRLEGLRRAAFEATWKAAGK